MTILKSLRGLGLVAAICVSATAGHAATTSFEFITKTWGRSLNGGTGNTDSYLSSRGVQGGGFNFGGQDVFLSGGFFHDAFFNANVGRVIYSTVPTTYGPGAEPTSFTGTSTFVSGGADYAPTDIVNGNAGFRTTDGNYGYVVFDWNATTDTMTFVSGAYETTANTAITVPSPVPLPAGMLLMIPGLLAFGAMRALSRRTD